MELVEGNLISCCLVSAKPAARAAEHLTHSHYQYLKLRMKRARQFPPMKLPSISTDKHFSIAHVSIVAHVMDITTRHHFKSRGGGSQRSLHSHIRCWSVYGPLWAWGRLGVRNTITRWACCQCALNWQLFFPSPMPPNKLSNPLKIT